MTPLHPADRQDRRWKIVWVPEDVALTAFRSLRVGDQLYLPALKNLPEDAVVVQVAHDWSRRCFGFLIGSASFEPVPEGAVPPDFEQIGEVEYKVLDAQALPGVQVYKLQPREGEVLVFSHPEQMCPADRERLLHAAQKAHEECGCKVLVVPDQLRPWLRDPAAMLACLESSLADMDEAAARKIGGEIRESVRLLAMVMTPPQPGDRAPLPEGEHTVTAVQQVGGAYVSTLQREPAGEPLPPEHTCTCPVDVLLAGGCQCGGK